MSQNYLEDNRTVMTLDAGGTNFVFSAMRRGDEIVEPVKLPAEANNLDASLNNLIKGFEDVKKQLKDEPVAISFAFPGPADYGLGIIGDLGNLPAYRGGIALGPMLEDHFNLPVLINNDGDLFAYGEAIGGYLNEVNELMERGQSPKRYNNLLGITLGTGFGAGIVSGGNLYKGDNSAAGEIWLMRHKLGSNLNAEEGASIRGVRRLYAEYTATNLEDAPSPKDIYEIAEGQQEGDRVAAQKAYQKMGELVGDALANAVTLLDGIIVIGGGLAGAHHLFLQSVVDEMNSQFTAPDGTHIDRLIMKVFNLEDDAQRERFQSGNVKQIQVPNSNRQISYDPEKRIGVGISRMDTSWAIALGAYAIALDSI